MWLSWEEPEGGPRPSILETCIEDADLTPLEMRELEGSDPPSSIHVLRIRGVRRNRGVLGNCSGSAPEVLRECSGSAPGVLR